ncbi:MAG TPA: pentapeptide repeat-containing protein [Ktedonosporobacter sp.]|jgi:uncharacterized protein YjbI with pentapeptide repeats|nr:pentapeptide repeat-containing protein [Ktedonosporobacter sp.]
MMPATRQQLEDRWEIEEGKQILETIQAMYYERSLVEQLPQLVARLPFSDEVAPHLDFRGIHTPDAYLDLIEVDLSGARFDYARNLQNITACQMIGTTFDYVSIIRGNHFENDFTNASFVQATLQGCRFRLCNLSNTNFREARLAVVTFDGTSCRNASFVEADLRFSSLGVADLRGADLRGADLTEAGLAEIQFDEQTQLQGAILRGAFMNETFHTFARQRGAILGGAEHSVHAYTLACVDTLIKILQEPDYNPDGHLTPALPYVQAQREKLAQDTEYEWSTPLVYQLSADFSEDFANEVLNLYGEAIKGLPYYL